MPEDPPPKDILKAFGAKAPVPVARTPIAAVWRVETPDVPAALKLYHREDRSNEAPGLAMLRHWGGNGAARVLGVWGWAVLLEWLDGPSLGDLTRAGRDDEAMEHLAAVALQLRGHQPRDLNGLSRLTDWIGDMLTMDLSPLSPNARAAVAAAQDMARHRLAAGDEPRAMHGDLHHDNIRMGVRGWCAFDPKGVAGPPAYEVANAFRNPKGAEALARDPARIGRMADFFCRVLDLERQAVLEWTAAKCALSIYWSGRGGRETAGDLALLPVLLTAADDASG